MNRREFTRLGLSASAAALARGTANPSMGQDASLREPPKDSDRSFALTGIYFHDGFDAVPKRVAPLYWGKKEWQKQLKWLAACGIDAIEFATQMEFSRVPETNLERNKVSNRLRLLDQAHELGMRFGYILQNTVISSVPPGEEPGAQQGGRVTRLCPREPGNFEKTIALQSWYLDTYKEADFMEEFAADWGGCTCGACNHTHYLEYVRVLAERLKTANSKAPLYANTWAIAWWGPDPLIHGWRRVFDLEIEDSRKVIDALPDLPDNTHIALPCSHLYRPLAYSSYGSKEDTPVFPLESDVRRVRHAGRSVLAWPHFVMDDDISRAPAWGIVHSEVRQMSALAKRLTRIGIDRIMGNLYLPNLQLSNTFALGCLSKNSHREPVSILKKFAKQMAHREDVEALTDVMCWLDNNSYWDEQMRQLNILDGHAPFLPCSLNKERASEILAAVRPRTDPELPLPVSAELWLADLRRSIARMAWAG